MQDELGSPIRLAEEDGKLSQSYGYDEFGQDVILGNQGEPFTLNRYIYCYNKPMEMLDPNGKDAILINKEVDNFIGVEHMSAFFQDKNGKWYFFFWGDTVKVHQVKDESIFSDMDSMNEYLYEQELYTKKISHIGTVYMLKEIFLFQLKVQRSLTENTKKNYRVEKIKKSKMVNIIFLLIIVDKSQWSYL